VKSLKLHIYVARLGFPGLGSDCELRERFVAIPLKKAP